jgi:transcriptional regulator with XRE-family HTH domain
LQHSILQGGLARLRQAAGYSQRDLSAETGISQRVIAYYESKGVFAPAHLIPALTKALGITCDQLMGLERPKDTGKPRDTRLWRRFTQLEKLSPTKRKQIVQILDAFIGTQIPAKA